MKSANTAIVQEPTLQGCGWDVSGNIIWANEHSPEKIAYVANNEYQGRLTMKIFMNQNMDGKAQVTIVH